MPIFPPTITGARLRIYLDNVLRLIFIELRKSPSRNVAMSRPGLNQEKCSTLPFGQIWIGDHALSHSVIVSVIRIFRGLDLRRWIKNVVDSLYVSRFLVVRSVGVFLGAEGTHSGNGSRHSLYSRQKAFAPPFRT